jgi:SNF2 family DNA or RNA helicase
MEAFKRGELPAVMGHPETISLGLDGLQNSCNNICWYGLPWNLLHYLQTIDRVVRTGSKSATVTLHRIIAKGTIDEDVLEVLDKKDAEQSDFLKLLGRLTQQG